MSEAVSAEAVAQVPKLTLGQLFMAFFLIGATSFGGGVVAYVRASIVQKHEWIDDEMFIEFLSISQSLPGLNATNMAVLIGNHLRGLIGSAVCAIAMGIPGMIFMLIVGSLYNIHGDTPWSNAILKGVAAAAVGLVLATAVQLAKKSLKQSSDFAFVLLAIAGIHLLHLSVPVVLLLVGAMSIYSYRPRATVKEDGET
jgi:chromate transporter